MAWELIKLEKCIDCAENERLYGRDTDEYMVGEYAERHGLCGFHLSIVCGIHSKESVCDFCEMVVQK